MLHAVGLPHLRAEETDSSTLMELLEFQMLMLKHPNLYESTTKSRYMKKGSIDLCG